MNSAYFYHWDAASKRVSVAYASDTANDPGKPRKIGIAPDRQTAKHAAEKHYKHASNMASIAGRASPRMFDMI